MPNYDAIVVPGKGLRALGRKSGEPFVPPSEGKPHLPANLDSDGRLLSESRAGARYLIKHGIEPNRIFSQSTSYGPHGFYFGRPDIPEYKESTHRAVEFFKEKFSK